MNVVATSPLASEAPSPMITSVTPTLDPPPCDPHHLEDIPSPASPGLTPGPSQGSPGLDLPPQERDPSQRSRKPPPMHTGADWKVVLHLPEIETWLRNTSERVRDLTHSVHLDSQNRHVDVHLVQLKDICEDISDHVEQIHALLETEFSLKLLSYSVSIIVDIRSVQLLWHQLRVSVLVLKERLLQGLQDSNGNYTRQTDILQAFSQDHDQTRLDALTEVDDCGQLTIKCSQDYFSLDCGITAYELSDYSPSDDPEGRGPGQEASQQAQEGRCPYPELQRDFPELLQSVDLLTIAAENLSSTQGLVSKERLEKDDNFLTVPTMHCDSSSTPQSESSLSKRPLQGVVSSEVSPTQPSLPPKRAMYLEGEDLHYTHPGGSFHRSSLPLGLQFQAELSRSTPSLLDPPDRSKFWLELDSVYPNANASQSYESLQIMNGKNLQRSRQQSLKEGPKPGVVIAPFPLQRSISEAGRDGCLSQDCLSREAAPGRKPQSDQDSPLPSPLRDPTSSDQESQSDGSSPCPPTKAAVWILRQRELQGPQVQAGASPERERWYGSEEFLALPAQLRKTEMLAMKLESLAQAIPWKRRQSCSQEHLQDVDDWELTELNPEWDSEETGEETGEEAELRAPPPPLLPPQPHHQPNHQLHLLQLPYRRPRHLGRYSPSSSSDMAPSLDDSIESGPLSDLLSEDEVWSSSGGESRRGELPRRQHQNRASPLACARSGQPLILQLLEDIQHQDHPDIWNKIEGFVGKLDEFICWLREALETTENWTPPKADLDALKLYLETHLSFKLNVDSHCSLKEAVLVEGRHLLEVLTSHKSGLRDMLQMISQQWAELQKQIRRQHSWMLRALDTIKARLLDPGPSGPPGLRQARTLTQASPDQQDPGRLACPKAEVLQSEREAHIDALEQINLKLHSLQYCSSTHRRRSHTHTVKNHSLQEFEAEYQELWDWLMDMDSVVTDSHELMMSEEQRQHLYKGNSVEMSMWLPKKTHLLGWAESLRRSGAELPVDFDQRVDLMTQKWNQLQKILEEHSGSCSPLQDRREALSPQTNGMVRQLEERIKELKIWLRDTELLIFNTCLRQDAQLQASSQLHNFKSLCLEVRGRRKGVASVLRLCQRLLEQGEQNREALQMGPVAQLHQGALQMGPEAEQHQEALQLLAINLERRWEAIVMQALQWQTRLKRVLGPEQVPGNFLEPALMDLHGAPPEDSWEWDEMDMTIADTHESHTHTPDLDSDPRGPQPSGLGHPQPLHPSTRAGDSVILPPPSSHHPVNTVYQVYSVHNIELYCQPHFPSPLPKTLSHKAHRKQLLLKSLSKDSSFSSVESLPDMLGPHRDQQGPWGGDSARRSESESGIVSEGDTETTANSEPCQLEEVEGEGEKRRAGRHLSTPRGADSPSGDRVCEEDINRILERANQGALYGDCVVLKREPRCKSGRKRREDSDRETRRKRENREIRKNREENEDARRKRDQDVEMRRKQQRDAVQILKNGRGFTPDSDSEGGFGSDGAFIPGGDKQEGGVSSGQRKSLHQRVFSPLPLLSQGSSLESLFTAGELFPAGKDLLPRSISLESWLAPGRSGEEMGSQGSLGELGPGEPGEPGEAGGLAPGPGGEGAGELSRRTLELLRRLENIQSPLAAKMTRSISDITLQSSSLRLPAPGARGGQRGPPSSVNESSAASLTELSSAEESSAASEDLAILKNRLFANTNASFRKRCQRGGAALDEADASVSMVVNVSCTSACTDDEDDSDLLSSSTPTLTEEELGVREGEESNMTSEEDEEEDEEEEDTEESFALGLEYMRNELQSWIKPRPSSSSSSSSPAARERGEADLGDELQCGMSSSSANDRCNRSTLKLLEPNANVRSERLRKQPQGGEGEANRRNVTRSYISQLVDDMENGNVDQSHLKRKDNEDELLMREEGSLYTKMGEACQDAVGGDSRNVAAVMTTCSASPSCELLPLENQQASLESQLRGEIPCHSSSHPSPSLSPMEDCRSHHALLRGGGRQAINSQETFSSFLREESRRQPASYTLSHAHPQGRPSCCSHAPSSANSPSEQQKGENVHDFVMEIIDMTNVALRNKENQSEQKGKEEGGSSSPPPLSSAQLAHIRDKVLEHSHRPIQLRKGDFYSYLSLSSHDSDCGEVSTCQESKNNTPLLSNTPDLPPATSPSPELPPPLSPTLDLQDQELLFEACTEEVYLGPPLCYSMVLTKRPRRRPSPKFTDSFLSCHLGSSPIPTETFLDDNQGPSPRPTASPDSCLLGPSAGILAVLSPAQSTAAAYQGHAGSPGSPTSSLAAPSRNEPASYLNPSRCESQIDTVECFADSKTLESNIAPVMTKISISCSSTNPLKEAGCASINPKINSAVMRGSDRAERGSGAQWMKQRNGRNGRNSLQDAKATQKQAPRSGLEGTRAPQESGRVTDRSSASSRPQVRRLSGPVASVPATAQL